MSSSTTTLSSDLSSFVAGGRGRGVTVTRRYGGVTVAHQVSRRNSCGTVVTCDTVEQCCRKQGEMVAIWHGGIVLQVIR